MIKIYDKLWFIIHENEEDNLAYMCQYETTEKGDVAGNVKKMQATGRSWAGKSDALNPNLGSGTVIDNLPTKNIYVGCSVSRWSTSNKLFRVTDPRGFTVEIPTDNLATLLHHTTVVKGIVQEECVWGKEGNNHILLPVNSEPYKLAKEQQDTLDNKRIPVSDLKVGDWVKLFGVDKEYYFFGRIKITWNVRGHKPKYLYNYNRIDEYTDWYEIEDKQYTNLFLSFHKYDGETVCYGETPTNPKIVEVLRNEPLDIDLKDVGWLNSPERVNNQLGEIIDSDYYYRIDSEVLSFKYKGE